MTGTPFCMLPVTSLNNVEIGDGKVGSKFKEIISCWSKNVGIDIIKQIKNWNLKELQNFTNKTSPYSFKK